MISKLPLMHPLNLFSRPEPLRSCMGDTLIDTGSHGVTTNAVLQSSWELEGLQKETKEAF